MYTKGVTMFFHFFFVYLFLLITSLHAMEKKGIIKKASNPIPIPGAVIIDEQKDMDLGYGCCSGEERFSYLYERDFQTQESFACISTGNLFPLEGELYTIEEQNEAVIKAINDNINFGKYSEPYELKQCIQKNFDANVTVANKSKITLLQLVARQKIEFRKNEKQEEQIRILLEVIGILKLRGANFTAKDDNGRTPYMLAKVLKKPQEVLDALIG